MQLGFALFSGLADLRHVYEVFPSASYSQLADTEAVQCRVSLGPFAPGPKDMLDAYVAAATAREYVQQRGQAVGGGDGYGEIVLPRPLSNVVEGVLQWPDV
jgi:hypothetical protein